MTHEELEQKKIDVNQALTEISNRFSSDTGLLVKKVKVKTIDTLGYPVYMAHVKLKESS